MGVQHESTAAAGGRRAACSQAASGRACAARGCAGAARGVRCSRRWAAAEGRSRVVCLFRVLVLTVVVGCVHSHGRCRGRHTVQQRARAGRLGTTSRGRPSKGSLCVMGQGAAATARARTCVRALAPLAQPQLRPVQQAPAASREDVGLQHPLSVCAFVGVCVCVCVADLQHWHEHQHSACACLCASVSAACVVTMTHQ
jgi:hypothetical protein